MKAFLQKYSGATHALATVWALLIAAYAGSDDFRGAVNAGAIAVYQALPHGLAALVSGLFGIAVPLWAFYRKGNPAPDSLASNSPATKAIASVALVALLCATMTGCTPEQKQQTVISVTQDLQTGLVALENIKGNITLSSKLQTDLGALVTAEGNWKAGTPAQEVIEAVQLVQADINLFPVDTEDAEFIDLGLGFLDQILELLPSAAPAVPTTTTVTLTNAVFVTKIATPVLHHRLAKPIGSEKDFRKRWNAIVKKHAELKAAKLK